jgi:hypothetical protein
MSTTNAFAELTADGQSAAFECPGDVNDIDVYLDDAETWGSGTLIVQSSPDGGTTWIAVASASWTSGDGYLGSVRAYGRDIRLSLSGSTTPSLTVTVRATPVASVVRKVATLTANGNTDFALNRAGGFALFALGTWDSGSLTLSVTPDNSSYYDSGLTALTADGGQAYANTPGDTQCRLVLASVVTASDIDVYVYETD